MAREELRTGGVLAAGSIRASAVPRPADTDTGLLGFPGGDAQFLALVAAAAPFSDRAAGVHFHPAPGARRELAARSNRWLQAAVGTGPSAAAATTALLRHRERTGRELGAGLLDVVVANEAALPEWAYGLLDFLLAQPLSAVEDPATGMVGAPFITFRRAAARLVDCRDGVLRGVRISDDGRDDVIGQLIERLTAACDAALGFEYDFVSRPPAGGTPVGVNPDGAPAGSTSGWTSYDGFDVSRRGWLERLDGLPALGHVIGQVCVQWRQAVREVFDRLYDDLPALRRELWDWSDPGELVEYSGDSGDLHDYGRVVSLLTFAGGQKVVYKPKNLATVVGFSDLLSFLNAHGAPLPLLARKAILRDGYGWEEFIRSADVGDPSEFADFYFRLGELCRVVQLLEGRDFWADNLLAVGADPVFIDLECLLQPRPLRSLDPSARRSALWPAIEDSVAPTMTVSAARPIAVGRPSQDIGCMAALEEQLAVDAGSFAGGWEPPRYRPRTADRTADPRRHHQDFLAGYQAMTGCLAGNAAALADPRGPLALFNGAPVRYIWRSTFDSSAVLRSSLSPMSLVSGVTREIAMARTFRTVVGMLGAGAEDDGADLFEIIEQEIEAFRRLDIPLFLSRTTCTTAYSPDGVAIAEHFSGTAWERVMERLQRLADRPGAADQPAVEIDPQFDDDVVRALLSIAAGGTFQGDGDALDAAGTATATRVGPSAGQGTAEVRASRRGVAVYRPSDTAGQVAEEELIAAASAIGDRVVNASVEIAPGVVGWRGVVHYPAYGLDQVEPLHGDLLSGCGGTGVFLAELFRQTGRPAYWTAATQAAAAAVEFAEQPAGSPWLRRMSGGLAPVGGFVGLGGVLYALARISSALGEPSLAATGARLLDEATVDFGLPMATDLVLGVSGLLLGARAILARPAARIPAAGPAGEPPWWGAAAAKLRGALDGGPGVAARPCPPGWAMAPFLPAGWAGVRYAGAVLSAEGAALYPDRSGGDPAAAVGGESERPGGARPGEQDGAGDPADLGEALALLGAARALGGGVPASVSALLRRQEGDLDGLGVGQILAVGDLSLQSALLGDSAQDLRLAHRCARKLLQRSRDGARMVAGPPDALHLSAVSGLPAVGLFLLRLADPGVPNLRLLETTSPAEQR